MKKLMIAGLLCASAMCAQQKKSDKPAAAPSAVTVPKDAVKNANGTYSYTDKDGRKWIYTNTPFGVVRVPGTDSDTQGGSPSASAVKVIDKGDTVRFERATPFGKMNWEKKKTDLTEEERKLFESQTGQSQPPAAEPDAK